MVKKIISIKAPLDDEIRNFIEFVQKQSLIEEIKEKRERRRK